MRKPAAREKDMDPITKISNNRVQPTITGNAPGLKAGGFEDTLKTFLQSTDQQLKESGQKTDEFAVGLRHDIHEIVIASEKAGLQFNLLLNIRNKVLEAYQEVMRMQF
jgi:flagellar hook-basal body complex protein FliE